MSARVSSSAERPFGVQRVCKLLGRSRLSVYAARRRSCAGSTPARRGPKTPHTDEQLTALIRDELAASPFTGEGHRKVWARLRIRGIRTSKRRVLRLMRAADLLAPGRPRRELGPRVHDGTIVTEAPDVMWGTDATAVWTTDEGLVTVFAAIDHCTAECVGIHAAKRATRHEALEPIRQGVRRCFGAYQPVAKVIPHPAVLVRPSSSLPDLDESTDPTAVRRLDPNRTSTTVHESTSATDCYGERVADGLTVRHDNGSQYTSAAFGAELRFLGIESSPSFVRSPEGNGCIERFFRTLEEQLLWVRSFGTAEDVRLAVLEWAETYNRHWLIERLGHRSPSAARRDLLALKASA